MDAYLQYVQSFFDYKYTPTTFSPIDTDTFFASLPDKFNIGLLVGVSGAGKTRLLLSLAEKGYTFVNVEWDERPIIQQIHPNPEIAINSLLAVGFSSIPQWFLSYTNLSEGQKFRAYLARCIQRTNILIDEFTSKLDRLTARNTAFGIHKTFVSSSNARIILASPFRDIIPYLNPDWIYDVSNNIFSFPTKEKREWTFFILDNTVSQVPTNGIDTGHLYINKSDAHRWERYKIYHYLSTSILTNCEYWEVSCIVEEVVIPIAYIAVCPLPLANIRAKREHRLVVLPEVQGMGIGIRLSEFFGKYYTEKGFRYYCKTSHPKLGNYRNRNPQIWKKSTHNGKIANGDALSIRLGSLKGKEKESTSKEKVYYCHEYISTQSDHKIKIKPTIVIDEDKWRPTTIVGTLVCNSVQATVRYMHKSTYFRYEEYNNPEEAKNSAIAFLEDLNIKNEKPNLYRYKDNGKIQIRIADITLIQMTTEEYTKIKGYKLFIRSDTSTRPIFYQAKKENGKKGRIYIRDTIEYIVVEE